MGTSDSSSRLIDLHKKINKAETGLICLDSNKKREHCCPLSLFVNAPKYLIFTMEDDVPCRMLNQPLFYRNQHRPIKIESIPRAIKSTKGIKSRGRKKYQASNIEQSNIDDIHIHIHIHSHIESESEVESESEMDRKGERLKL